MFGHVVFGISDYEASKSYFLKALEPLEVAVVSEGPHIQFFMSVHEGLKWPSSLR